MSQDLLFNVNIQHMRIPFNVFQRLDFALLKKNNATRPKPHWLIPHKPGTDDSGFAIFGGATLVRGTGIDDGYLYFGASLCSITDKFDPVMGKRIALGRAVARASGRDRVEYTAKFREGRYHAVYRASLATMFDLIQNLGL